MKPLFSISLPLASQFGEGNGVPLQYSCLENPMDRGAQKAAVHAVSKSQTRLRDLTFTFHFHALEREMATHSSVLPGESQGRGAQWAAVYGVAQSWTRLKRRSSSSSSLPWPPSPHPQKYQIFNIAQWFPSRGAHWNPLWYFLKCRVTPVSVKLQCPEVGLVQAYTLF